MGGIIVFILTMALYLWLSSLGSKGNKSGGNKKFGDGNNRYDYSDYVNSKIDKDKEIW